MRKATSKSVIARNFVLKSKFMFGGRAPPEPAGKLERSPRHPGRSGCHGRERSLAQLGALCGEEEGVEIQNVIIHQFLTTDDCIFQILFLICDLYFTFLSNKLLKSHHCQV